MEIEAALVAYLKTQEGLTALVDTRIYPDEAEEGAVFPYVVYIDVSDVKDHSLTGQSSLERPIKQLTVYAESKPSAKAVAAQIKAAMCDYTGELSGLEVQYIKLINEFSSKEKTGDGSMSVSYIDLEFEINYVRS